MPSKATLARLEAQARGIAEIKRQDKKLAVIVLDELMTTAAGAAGAIQRKYPTPLDLFANEKDEVLFRRYLELAGLFAKALAPFQSFKLKAMLVPPPVDPALISPVPADKKVIIIDDPAAQERLYRNRIQKVPQKVA